MIKIKWKKVHSNAQQPTKSYSTDACFDLFCVADKTFNNGNPKYRYLFDKESYTFDTGIQVSIPEGYGLFLWDRSSLGSKDIHRFAGVLDCGYLGNIFIHLFNHGKQYYKINEGDRICQAYIAPIFDVEWDEVEELESTLRMDQGFGSSGR